MAQPGPTAMTQGRSPARRLVARAFRPLDADAIAAWFPEALAAAYGRFVPPHTSGTDFFRAWTPARTLAGGVVAFVRPPSDEPIGVAVWEAAATGAAIIRLIVIHRTHRGWGLGAEAVLRMEEQVGAREVWVPIPPDNGLAVYFWLRLGYHPVLQVDQPPFARREGGLWMMRSIAGTLEQ